MATLSRSSMRRYLRASISSLNENKLRGLLAEVELRAHLAALGYAGRVSPGGWIVRTVGPGNSGKNPSVFFPEVMMPLVDYAPGRTLPAPPAGLHSVAAVFQRIGLASYFCAAVVPKKDDPSSVTWHAQRLALPQQAPWTDLVTALAGFTPRQKKYPNRDWKTVNVRRIADAAVPEEFSKERLRLSIAALVRMEISDVDAVFYGQKLTYPVEIKEKTAALDPNGMGEWFGLDVGPFTKLAFYAAMGGDLSSLFIVRQINDTTQRALVAWRFATFAQLARYAAWTPVGGGRSMTGGGSTVVRIPLAAFGTLDASSLAAL